MLDYEIVLTELLVRVFNTVEVDFHTPDHNFSYHPSSKKLLLCFLLLKSYVLLKFLFVLRSEVVMINAFERGDLLDDLLKKLNQDHYHISHQDNGGMDYVISLDDFQNQVIKLKGMFDVPSIEVPAATMMNQLFLEMRDIMRLQAESMQMQDNNRALF
ncbi:hypothetical protein [Parasitella parasitica]|uniref:Uncharacterized protein n=1 Tax=Parasitella parasitica TaxID=35722 RepID=A0A0B7NGP7_9FUNG|nr:hypothetical protein [Parasitella parasitica]